MDDLTVVIAKLKANYTYEKQNLKDRIEIPELEDLNMKNLAIKEIKKSIENLKEMNLGDLSIYKDLIKEYKKILKALQ